MNPTETSRYFEARSGEMIEMIREIVEIESPSRDVERSRQVVTWVENEARKIALDLEIERTRTEEYGDHIVIRAFPGDGKGTLLLGHTDTVHPVGTKQLNPTRIDDGRFYGCGIFDMKAGIVLMLEALRYFAESNTKPEKPVTILLSCDEEVGSFTGRELVERESRNAEACLVFEPSSNGRVKTGRKGTGMFTVKTWGRPAHAGLEPEKGASAILELARQIESLNGLNDLTAGTTVNVCTIKGGTTTNVIPEHAECTVDVRFTAAAEAVRVETAIRGLTPVDERVKILVTGGINRPPLERTREVAALFENARSIAAEFGYELGETQVGGASDGNFVAALGVPVLDGLGIAGDGAHRMDEHILIDDIAKRATLVTSLLLSSHRAK
ncbi:MAG TPA: M20 family metallopeptidase [Pyrinomonadaceae bacterium]|nr:M20 family metallopeptidase [Pyrinomonadaceae bacterium]